MNTRQALWANIASEVSVTPKSLYHDSPIEWADHVLAEYDKRFPDTQNWEQIAAQHLRNECYYRDIVVQIGEALGVEAKTCDDGSVVPDVLCAKVAELAIQRFRDLDTERDCIIELRAELIEVREAWNSDHMEMKRRVDGVPEPQYRELEHGEAILITDEWLGDDGQWQVRESVQPGERLFLGGKSPVEGLHPPERGGHHVRHRRRVDGAVPGYRILTVGETILDGDEYLGISGKWFPTRCVGESYKLVPDVDGGIYHSLHRRPL
jgi:hypothetical protein